MRTEELNKMRIVLQRLNIAVTHASRICVGMTHNGLRWYDTQGTGSNGSRGVNTSQTMICNRTYISAHTLPTFLSAEVHAMNSLY